MPADVTPNRSDTELLAAVHGRVATTRASRARRTFVALGAATAATLLVASGVAVAGNGGDEHHAVAAGEPTTTTTAAPEETLPLTEATTTTTEAPPVTAPTTTNPPVVHATATTTAPARTRTTATTTPPKKASASPEAVVGEVSPPSRDPARVYVAARGRDADSYVNRMTLDWGDGTAATNFDYPMSSCQPGPSTQAADANHRYAQAGTYVVRLIVTSVRCDGSDSRSESGETTVTYPSPASA